jgi:hypothetical protein
MKLFFEWRGFESCNFGGPGPIVCENDQLETRTNPRRQKETDRRGACSSPKPFERLETA